MRELARLSNSVRKNAMSTNLGFDNVLSQGWAGTFMTDCTDPLFSWPLED